ncbi:MAG TPA: hypothetical protein VK053_17545, partial [Jiangellaceae bacterium]|nr:hypothetical protein [Jiangellaceae bacterium]
MAVVLTAALLGPMAAATDTARPLEDQSLDPMVGEVVTVAGTGDAGYSGDGLNAVDARINEGASISVGPDGTLRIADAGNKRLRAVSPDGVIDTVPGTRATRSPETDGPEVDGFFFSPSNAVQASTVGPDGALYIAADQDIRRVDESGEHTVIGGDGEASFDDDGDGGDGGPATEAWIYEPTDIDVDADGNVYVADPNNRRVRKIDPEGTITTVAGGDEEDGDAQDHSLSVSFAGRLDVAVDSGGTVYVATEYVVHAVDPDGTFRTVAGDGEPGYAGDGGPAAEASIGEGVGGIAVDDEDNLYIADVDNNAVRRVDPDGVITTVGGGLGTVNDIAVGPDGNVYLVVGAEVRMLVRDGVEPEDLDEPEGEPSGEPAWADEDPGTVVTVAGAENDTEDGPEAEPAAPESPENEVGPRRVAVADQGTVYYADPDRNQVGVVDADGTEHVVAGTDEEGFAGEGESAENAGLSSPSGVATHEDGSVYIADTGNSRVRRITPGGDIVTVAGSGMPDDDEEMDLGDGGPATDAVLPSPSDVAVDADGSLYIADSTGRIRQVA